MQFQVKGLIRFKRHSVIEAISPGEDEKRIICFSRIKYFTILSILIA